MIDRHHRTHLSLLLLTGALSAACKQSSSGGDSSCFRLDQPVQTPNGPIAIGRLCVGDTVWSVDPVTGDRVAQRISRVVDSTTTQMLRLQFADRVVEAVTGAHPFFDRVAGTWKRAANLRIGDRLASDKGTVSHLVGIRHIICTSATPVRTLTMAGLLPTFLASGLVVHNKTESDTGSYIDADGDEYFGTKPDGPGPDCDDTNPDIHPDAPEDCANQVDDDCDGLVDEDDPDCQDTGGR